MILGLCFLGEGFKGGMFLVVFGLFGGSGFVGRKNLVGDRVGSVLWGGYVFYGL